LVSYRISNNLGRSWNVVAGGGATIGEVDAACAPHHFIVPVGRAHTTGCAGQMLYTGAHGYNERMHGLGIDYMTSATVVVSRNGGEIVMCSEQLEPELFWAVRGGGPHTCIVCEMKVSIYAPTTYNDTRLYCL
jgi:FAD/FMN-containing dehydrogenase